MELTNNFIDDFCIPKNLLEKNIKPFDFQYDGIRALVGKTRFLISSEAGLGKSIQLIVAVNVLQHMCYQKAKSLQQVLMAPLRVLVICPKSMLITWDREIKKWSTADTQYTIINHDKLIGKDSDKLCISWDIVIADESHQFIKHIDTLRAKMFLQIISNVGIVWLSTATPASVSGEDYYVTLSVLLPKLFGTWSKSQFVRRYCKKVADKWAHSGFTYVGFNNTEELKKVFSTCAIKHKQSEVKKDLPPLTFTDYFADVDYKDLKTFTPEEAKEIRRKILEGESFGSNYHARMQHNALLKVPSVLELLNTYEAGKKVVIFAWHRLVVDKLVEEIKNHTDRTVDFITGEVTSSIKRQEIIDRFQERDLTTLVLNMQSGGTGITLTKATAGIYVQYPYTPEFWVQSMKRIHRIGSLEPVQIVKVMIEKSIDEEIFSILQERMDYIKEVGV